MGTVLHKDLLATENHKIQYWTWASEAARLAQSVAPSDIGKVGYQTDTKTFFILTDWSPASWSPLSTYSTVGVVRAQYAASTAQTCAASTPINFDTKVVDTDNAVSAAAAGVTGTWKFTCPAGRGGSYLVSGALVFNGAHTVNLAKNGAVVKALTTTTTNSYSMGFSTVIDLNPGDYISLWATGGLATIAGVTNNHVEITRIPDSGYAAAQVVPMVSVMAARAAAQTVSTTDALVQFDTEYVDSHNAFTTGASARFTAPVAGVYSIKAILNLASAGSGMSISIYKNGALQISDGGPSWMASVTTDALLAAGDYIEVKARSWAGTSPNLTCNLQITRYADQAVAPTVAGYSPSVARCSASAGSVPASALTIVNFDTKSADLDNAVTVGASWRYTCPAGKGGRYSVKAALQGTSSGAGTGVLRLYKNGAEYATLDIRAFSSGFYVSLIGSADVDLLPGDYVDVRLYHTSTAALTLSGYSSTVPLANWVQISSLSTYAVPDQAKPSAKVRCSTAWTAATGGFTLMPFDSKVWDTHSAFTLGASSKFTAPLTGKYRVTCTTSSATATQSGLYVFKNGATDSMLVFNVSNSSYLHGSTIVDLVAGDYVDVRVFISGATRVCDAAPSQNWATIEYIGP